MTLKTAGILTLVLPFIGWIIGAVQGFKNDEALAGVLCLFFPLVGGILLIMADSKH